MVENNIFLNWVIGSSDKKVELSWTSWGTELQKGLWFREHTVSHKMVPHSHRVSSASQHLRSSFNSSILSYLRPTTSGSAEYNRPSGNSHYCNMFGQSLCYTVHGVSRANISANLLMVVLTEALQVGKGIYLRIYVFPSQDEPVISNTERFPWMNLPPSGWLVCLRDNATSETQHWSLLLAGWRNGNSVLSLGQWGPMPLSQFLDNDYCIHASIRPALEWPITEAGWHQLAESFYLPGYLVPPHDNAQ